MELMQVLIEFLQAIFSNIWMVAFFAIWILGYWLKEFTTFNNKLIPWLLLPVACFLGWMLIEQSVAGAIMGAVICWLQVASYDYFKGALVLFKK